MRITCIGEGQAMQRIIPQLRYYGYDASYFSRDTNLINTQLQEPIQPTALPQAIHESTAILFFVDHNSLMKYPLSRDCRAALANKTAITINGDSSVPGSFHAQLQNNRTDSFHIHFQQNMSMPILRNDQSEKWENLVAAICTPAPKIQRAPVSKNVVPGPWIQTLHAQFDALPRHREQPMN